MTLVYTALLGGLGSAARFLIDTWVNKRNRLAVPLGTIVVNFTACLLMGILTGWATSHAGSGAVRLLLGSGFLGGYSTFSTASVEGLRLIEAHQSMRALWYTGGMLILSLAGALLGFVIG